MVLEIKNNICRICKGPFKPCGAKKTCSKECSIKNRRLTQIKYFADPIIHEKHKKYMKQYMARPEMIKKENIRKKSPKYLKWQKKYMQTARFKELLKKRQQKQR